MKIASFNANGIRARIPLLGKWLEKESPDILCIQETKVRDQDFPKQPFEECGYHCRFKGQKGFNGVAVLSKIEPSNVKIGFGDMDEKEGARLIALEIKGLTIVNSYVPQGRMPDSESFKYKIAWFGRLRKYFEHNFSSDDSIVWAGDFNVAPEPMDVYDPQSLSGSIGYHPEEHRALANVMEWGFIDVYRIHNPREKAFSFWDYRIRNAVKRGLGWRIDHICATRCVAEKSRNARIDFTARLLPKPSDHTFVIAEFDL